MHAVNHDTPLTCISPTVQKLFHVVCYMLQLVPMCYVPIIAHVIGVWVRSSVRCQQKQLYNGLCSKASAIQVPLALLQLLPLHFGSSSIPFKQRLCCGCRGSAHSTCIECCSAFRGFEGLAVLQHCLRRLHATIAACVTSRQHCLHTVALAARCVRV
jgi:hypothetical protein